MLTGKALMYRIIGRRCLYRTNSWEIRRIQWISPPDLREGLFFTSRRRLFYDKIATWRVGGAVTQRSAKPFRPVQLWYAPPRLFRSVARVAELVYAADLKSASFTGLWVRVSSRAPDKRWPNWRSFFVFLWHKGGREGRPPISWVLADWLAHTEPIDKTEGPIFYF